MMLLTVAFLCAYAGFAALCAVAGRSIRLVWKTPPQPATVTLLRTVGFLLLAVAWIPCDRAWDDWAMGTVAWSCVLPCAAMILVLPFSYFPRPTIMSGGVAAVLASVLSFYAILSASTR